MKSKITYLLLATLLITNCIMLFMLVTKPHEKHIGKRDAFLIKNLNFSDEQKEKFLILEEAHLSARINFDEEILKKKKELFDSFVDSNVVNETITARIGELEGKKEKGIFSFFNKVKALCTKEQQVKFEKIIKEALLQGQSPRGGDGRPPHGERGAPPRGDMPPPRRN